MDLNISKSRAPKQRLSEFMSWAMVEDNHPAHNNRYSVSFATPKVLAKLPKYNLEVGDNSKLLNFYANSINLPSKQVTTGSVTNIGSTYNYATSSTFSQISISFTMPRNHKTRMIFERWISTMSSDANQYTDYYENYVCPHLHIYKWERGGGPEFALPAEWLKILRDKSIDPEKILKYKQDKLVGIYDIRNVFPQNIGSMTLTNDQAGLLQFDVTFMYERYRFYGDGFFDSPGTSYGATGATPSNPNGAATVSSSAGTPASVSSRAVVDPRERARNLGT